MLSDAAATRGASRPPVASDGSAPGPRLERPQPSRSRAAPRRARADARRGLRRRRDRRRRDRDGLRAGRRHARAEGRAGRGARLRLGHLVAARASSIHGGLRYLEQQDFGLVREALRERGAAAQRARAAPRHARCRSCYRSPSTGSARTSAPGCCSTTTLGGHEGLPPPPPPDQAPRAADRAGAEAATRSSARSSTTTRRSTTPATRSTVARTAAAATAPRSPSNARVVGFLREGERVTGVRVRDDLAGEEFDVRRARCQRHRRVDRRRAAPRRRARQVQGARVQGHPPRGPARPDPARHRADPAHREERAVRDPVGPPLDRRHDRHRLGARQGAPGRVAHRHRLRARARQRRARPAARRARTSRASTPGCGRC